MQQSESPFNSNNEFSLVMAQIKAQTVQNTNELRAGKPRLIRRIC